MLINNYIISNFNYCALVQMVSGPEFINISEILQGNPEVYLEPSQTSKIELLTKIVKD